MARAWREEYKGGIYHVIARGNNKEYIFNENIDKGYFIKQLTEYSKIMGYTVYGYVLMDNHYHLIIQTKDKKLQEIMHQINNKYSKYFNSKYNRVGHVFQGRYKEVLVQDERYIIRLLRYIHQNPIRAGICNKVSRYKWSSDIYYRKHINSFVDVHVILEMLDKNETQALKKYMDYMEVEERDNYSKLNAIGEEAFRIMSESRKEVKQRKRLDEILIETGASFDDYQKIKSASRKRALTEYKLKYAIVAIESGYTFGEIGDYIGMSAAAIRDMLNRYNL